MSALSKWKRLRTQLANQREKTERAVEYVTVAIEGFGAAFLVGITHGKWGGISILGIPLELGAGIALNLAGFLNAAGKNSHHLHALGNGALAAFASELGRDLGSGDKAVSGRRLIGGRPPNKQIGPANNAAADDEIADYIRERIAIAA